MSKNIFKKIILIYTIVYIKNMDKYVIKDNTTEKMGAQNEVRLVIERKNQGQIHVDSLISICENSQNKFKKRQIKI